MAKINLTKTHLTDLEKAVKMLKGVAKEKQGSEKKEIRDVMLTISELLIRHDNRLEKDY